MLKWVEELVLKPYVDKNVPNNIQPLLLLDSYRCHTMASVAAEIADLGVEVKIIPGGCTGMCQPIDVGIGKLLKTICRHPLWEEWMVKEVTNNPTVACRPASRLQMTSEGGNTSFAEKPELILLKITSFFFSDLLKKKLRITRNRIVNILT